MLDAKVYEVRILGQTSEGNVVISFSTDDILVLSLNSDDLSLNITKWFKIPISGNITSRDQSNA